MDHQSEQKTGLQKNKKVILITLSILLAIAILYLCIFVIFNPAPKPKIDKQIIKSSEYTYTDEPIGNIEYVVIHYVANPGSSAQANRNYFNNLATNGDRKASAHFVIGLDGEIIQCVPLDKAPFANGNEYINQHAISIECCHPDSTGEFNEKTIASLKKLVLWLCKKYNLNEDDVIRHYDASGKQCPVFYVDEDKWSDLKSKIFLK